MPDANTKLLSTKKLLAHGGIAIPSTSKKLTPGVKAHLCHLFFCLIFHWMRYIAKKARPVGNKLHECHNEKVCQTLYYKKEETSSQEGMQVEKLEQIFVEFGRVQKSEKIK